MPDVLDTLFATIAARKGGDAGQSYTAKLLAAGVEKCAAKFGEEATEAVIAAIRRDKTELAKESADVLYHLMVLWAASGMVEPSLRRALILMDTVRSPAFSRCSALRISSAEG